MLLGQKEPLEDKRITHGICEQCLEQNFLPVQEEEQYGDRTATAEVSPDLCDMRSMSQK